MIIKGEATFDDYKAQYPEVVEFLEAEHGSPLPEPIQQLLLDMATSSVMQVEQTTAWVDRAAAVTIAILKEEAHPAEYAIFWIHLYGIVDEYYEKENEFRWLVEKLPLTDFKRPILQSLDSIRTKLTNEDLSLIRFMRHYFCHMQLDYLWHKAKVKDGKIVKVKPPYDPNARDIAARVIEEHNGDQQAVARTYARKIVEGLIELKKALLKAAEAI